MNILTTWNYDFPDKNTEDSMTEKNLMIFVNLCCFHALNFPL